MGNLDLPRPDVPGGQLPVRSGCLLYTSTDIVKVDMFLNHRLDTDLFVKMGQAFAQEFAQEKPDLVLTLSLIHI